MLICIAGYGWYQGEGKYAVSLEPGKIITIKVPGEDTLNEWCEQVSAEEYYKLG